MTSSSSSTTLSQPPLARHDSRLLDLAFAMDTTGSMGGYISSATSNIRRIVEDIVAKESSNVCLALVNYRDHPPQERSYVTEVHDFTPRVADMKNWLQATGASGGGDAPEAVADALHDVLKLSWRPEATKICVLISDAPPHGLASGGGDSFPNGCPLGHDTMGLARQLAEKGVTLYVAGCEPSLLPYKDFFAALAYVTGGQYVPLSAAAALTPVIVGGAQEELSLEQWMDTVNDQVMAEVQRQGQDNVNVEDLSRDVMAKLNTAGVRSKQLHVQQQCQARASSQVKDISACMDMAAVRENWRPQCEDIEPRYTDMLDLAPGGACRGGSGPMLYQCAPAPPAMNRAMRSPGLNAFSGGAPEAADYSTEEGEVNEAQAERMVQKALMRNRINLPRK